MDDMIEDEGKMIVPAPGESVAEKMMMIYDFAPETVRAITILRSRQTPENMISEHPGKGGTVFKYIKHTYCTELLLDAMPAILYDWEVLDWENFEKDHSAVARGKLTIKFKMANGEWVSMTLTEVGAFEDITKKMPSAMKIASAASRALPRCMMRAFGLGMDLYPDNTLPSIGWWNAVKKYAESRTPPVPEEAIVEYIKGRGIDRESLKDHYEEVMTWVTNFKK